VLPPVQPGTPIAFLIAAILQGQEPPAMPVTIVVADDEEQFREIVRFLIVSSDPLLSDTLIVVGEASDGEEALAMALRERPDIVISDLVMPRLNGIDLTKRIRQELPQTRVILISSFTEDAYRLMASDSGADAFVSKQVIFDNLLPAIRDVIRRRFSGGSGSLPPSSGGSSVSAGSPF
jgi:DNA-binding NarL/FixJ family response regulator